MRTSMILTIVTVFNVHLWAEFQNSTKNANQDKSAAWTAGTIWTGRIEQIQRTPTGNEVMRHDASVIVTKREGKSFEGRYETVNGGNGFEIKGLVDPKGAIEFTITKILTATEEFKQSKASKNVVGLKFAGRVDGKSFKARYVWPVFEDVRAAPRIGTVELTLKE